MTGSFAWSDLPILNEKNHTELGPNFGFWVILLSFIAVLFAFSTIVSWSYYGEQCWVYLLGIRTILIYKGLFPLCLWLGVVFNAGAVIDFGEAMILAMAFPNMFGAILLSGRIKRELDTYLGKLRAGAFPLY